MLECEGGFLWQRPSTTSSGWRLSFAVLLLVAPTGPIFTRIPRHANLLLSMPAIYASKIRKIQCVPCFFFAGNAAAAVAPSWFLFALLAASCALLHWFGEHTTRTQLYHLVILFNGKNIMLFTLDLTFFRKLYSMMINLKLFLFLQETIGNIVKFRLKIRHIFYNLISPKN